MNELMQLMNAITIWLLNGAIITHKHYHIHDTSGGAGGNSSPAYCTHVYSQDGSKGGGR